MADFSLDVSPNGYSSPMLPFIPDARKEAEEQQRKETLAQLPLLNSTVNRFKQREAKTDSIQEARKLVQKHDISVENALIVLSELNSLIASERRYIETRVQRASSR